MTTQAPTPRTDAISEERYPDVEVYRLARTLERELAAARRDLKEAMKYAAHHGGCAEYHGAGEDCVCGLAALRERIAKEGM